MPKNFLLTKAFPASAVLFIYWFGSFNFPTIIFLPSALSIIILVFYITRKYGDKKASKLDK
ncbi:MAG: hypothetical protein OFPII_25110 [Osedax symbiont Rs1]|nr:MAG: hypothetical protein OFPII_25110 [Osedax symbiont Rs1]